MFPKGFGGIIKEVKAKITALDETDVKSIEKREFYESILLTSKGIIRYANRYAEEAERLGKKYLEKDKSDKRGLELMELADICRCVPECPPKNFREAIQFIWFTQIGGILSENPLSLNPGRFDQYMYPYYKADLEQGKITKEEAQELIESLWLKYSEWVWTISVNTADYFAGYNQLWMCGAAFQKNRGMDSCC